MGKQLISVEGLGTSGQVPVSGGAGVTPAWATPAGGNVSTSGTPVDNDFAKFVNGTDIEGRSYAEVKTDLSLNNVPNTDCTNASNISSGTLPSAVIPPVAMTTVQVADSQVAMLALTTEEGDVVVRSDENKSYMHDGGSAGDMTDFTELSTPTDSVLSVNGEVGTVVLTTGDIGEDANKKYVTDSDLTNLSNLSNTNSGDQTSIVGITGTKAQFDTAVTDGNILYDGDAPAETATSIGALIGGAGDATPNNTDFVATSLTAGGILKKITWTNVKAFLKTYFDTLYGSLTSQETGWNSAGETWTYSSVDDPTGVITVPTDATTKYSLGMRISFVNGGNTIYGIITAVTSTTITFLHEIDPTDSQALHLMANSAITVPKYSTQKAPFGFPLEKEKWSIVLVSITNGSVSSVSGGTWSNISSLSISKPIGHFIANAKLSTGARISSGSALAMEIYASLSTSNNSESDDDMTGYAFLISESAGSYTRNYATWFLTKPLEETVKTTYYPIHKCGITTTNMYNNDKIRIELVSAYL